MKTLTILFLAALLLCSCKKKATVPAVSTEVQYSHVNSATKTLTRHQAIGTVSKKAPNSGGRLTLEDKSEVWFRQSTDASDPTKIIVTIESWVTGGAPEVKTLKFNLKKPVPAKLRFGNGLMTSVKVFPS